MLSPYILETEDPAARFEHFVRLGAILFLAAGALGSLAAVLPGSDLLANPDGITVVAALSMVAGAALLTLSRFVTPAPLYLVYFGGIMLTTLGTHFAGQQAAGFVAMIYTWQMSLGFCMLSLRWLIPPLAAIAVGFATVLALDAPVLAQGLNAWLFTMGTVIVTGAFVNSLVRDLHRAATSDRMARTETERAREELALLNHELEERVDAKVLEVERLSDLRRLVSSHVADALLESDRALEPHRREIAVFFIDLRNFTKFAMDCDPEEVIQVLDAFYLALGKSFKNYNATVGAFEADGVMAYFNDPVPTDDPAQKAVEMALSLCAPMNNLVERWQNKGFDLHYGIGIALGYATMGMVGFEGRQDYTAIGTVVNLASRLCGEATKGEILIDRKVRQAISRDVVVEDLPPRPLKGFREPVPLYRVSPVTG